MAIDFIYAEVDPRGDIPFYVGITNDPKARHQAHTGASTSNEQKREAIQQLRDEGVESEMRILEVIYNDREKALERERYWIAFHTAQGIQLTNIRYVRPAPKRQKQAYASTFRRALAGEKMWLSSHEESSLPKERTLITTLSDLLPGRKIRFEHLSDLWVVYQKEYPSDTVEQFLATIPPDRIYKKCDNVLRTQVEWQDRPIIHPSF